MTTGISKQTMLIDAKKRRLQELRNRVVREEVKLLVPTLDCLEPELVEKCRLDRIAALNREIEIETYELVDLEARVDRNLEFAF